MVCRRHVSQFNDKVAWTNPRVSQFTARKKVKHVIVRLRVGPYSEKLTSGLKMLLEVATHIWFSSSATLFITVKTITKLSLEHRRRGSRSPDNAEFGHFTLLFCRERQRNVSRIITHVYGGRELPLIFLMVFYFKVTISIRNKLIWNAKKMLI